MRKHFTLCSVLVVAALLSGIVPAPAQTHVFPALDTNNVWTGKNDFTGSVIYPFHSGTLAQRPATCLASDEVYNVTDSAAPGRQLYICNPAGNGWEPFAGNESNEEGPAGQVNGTNITFTLAHAPVAGSLKLVLNGLTLHSGAGNDYTISGNTITMLYAPLSGGTLLAWYEY
jgi:hypothetical protein